MSSSKVFHFGQTTALRSSRRGNRTPSSNMISTPLAPPTVRRASDVPGRRLIHPSPSHQPSHGLPYSHSDDHIYVYDVLPVFHRQDALHTHPPLGFVLVTSPPLAMTRSVWPVVHPLESPAYCTTRASPLGLRCATRLPAQLPRRRWRKVPLADEWHVD
ncbi:hypothetical protein C8F04DRAFT_299601 [Mycena alexandri]|uniref:Uncharacterized protein n=1 Tax=Mycena alexandri TaxID=1745969 RepID=A0AAD6T5G7_9AGAR|nr:hypothetical protein C8F04DRAFT_299601 [Mycena alexandri]